MKNEIDGGSCDSAAGNDSGSVPKFAFDVGTRACIYYGNRSTRSPRPVRPLRDTRAVEIVAGIVHRNISTERSRDRRRASRKHRAVIDAVRNDPGALPRVDLERGRAVNCRCSGVTVTMPAAAVLMLWMSVYQPP